MIPARGGGVVAVAMDWVPMMQRGEAGGVPLVWVEPKRTRAGAGQRQLVIWLPGFSGGKESTLPQLEALAAQGLVALSFDPWQHGERLLSTREELCQRVAGNIRRYFWPILAHSAEEVSGIIDWAQARLEVAPHVGIGGISMGGDIAVAAAGLDARLAVVAAGIATPDWLRPGSFEPPGEADAAAQAAYDRCNPLTHLETYAHLPAISFQCGAEDGQVPPDGAARFVEALRQGDYATCPERLEAVLHPDTGHSFTTEMWENCRDWLVKWM